MSAWPDDPVLVNTLRTPGQAPTLTPTQWALLVQQARAAGLTGHLALVLRENGGLADAPPEPRQHLMSAQWLVAHQVAVVRREVGHIRRALAPTGAPFALLKGAAFLATGVPPSQGRLFSDVHILVARRRLAPVVQALRDQGWHSDLPSAHAQRHHRRWMHALPRMTHLRRGTSLEVHHALPPDSVRRPLRRPGPFDGWQPVDGEPGVFVLPPVDMLLHSATQLFHASTFRSALRDLVDLDALLRHFGQVEGFWPALVSRSHVLKLQRPLFYALRYTGAVLGTPVPEAALVANAPHGPAGPLDLPLRLMDACWQRAFLPPMDCHDTLDRRAARALLYLRSHALRLPAPVLAGYLAGQAWQALVALGPAAWRGKPAPRRQGQAG